MQRRDFLRGSVGVGGVIGLGASGCAGMLGEVPMPSIQDLLALDMDGFLKSLDTSLGVIQSSSGLDAQQRIESFTGLRARPHYRDDPRFTGSDELVRKTLRSMLVAGSFRDLSEEGRAHPGMQARVWNSMAEMDDTVLGMNKVLSSLTPTERADIGRTLRSDPAVGLRALSALDAEAERAGVTVKRREHLQAMGNHVCFRLRQSPGWVIDEYADKVKKASAFDGSVEASQRRMLLQMGEEAFWQYHARQNAIAQAWQNVPGIRQHTAQFLASVPYQAPAGTPSPGAPAGAAATTAPPVAAPAHTAAYTPTPPEYWEAPKPKRGTTLLTVGGILFGVGAVLGITGGVLLATETGGLAGAFILTAAGALGLAGIVCLIVGGVLYSNS